MNKNGYMIIEGVLSISIMLIITGLIYQLLFYNVKIKEDIENNTELQQQALESISHIEKIIQKSRGIINIKECGSFENLNKVKAIKCRYKTEDSVGIKDKEILYKSQYDKLFINNLSSGGGSLSGGYEIGDYITNLYIGINESRDMVKVKVELEKNKYNYNIEKVINILNFEGD